MAMNIDRNTSRSQGGVFEKNMPVSTFLRDTFFSNFETFPTSKVELDFRKGTYNIAPFVAPLVAGINMKRQGYQTREYEPPTIAPKRVLDPKVLQTLTPGEHTYSLKTPAERQQYYIERDMQEMSDAIDRREEEMVSQLITTGKIVVRGYYDESLTKHIENTIDYDFTQKEVLSGDAAWDKETSDKYDDLQRAVDKVREAGYNPTFAILGQLAWKLLRDDEKFMKKLDIKRMELGVIAPELKLQNGTGMIYVGDLTELGLQLWVYYGFYKDYDGQVKKFIPEDHIVIAPGVIGDIRYGAVTYLEPISLTDGHYVTYEGTRIPRTLINPQNNVKEMILSSKPIPRPYDVDSWYVLDVKG